MKIHTNVETVDAIKTVIAQQADKPNTIRVFLAGMGCSGPSFGLALDDQKETDLVDPETGINFIMDTDLFNQFGDIKVEFRETGYYVAPINQVESTCGSCGGGCGE